ncbi:transglycosylase SLT domain-containing protein [Oculatella sp. FACHB-28]|uniref:lysozyme n=1 Tax=Oculatella sp. FACHB-28 TaxID=2692845 RepID=UPI00168787C9|nr:transglycosylase SLT domain-containing protein [Oculatella sp. FACHB-28]MBD2054619.1 transglycosylase SLT domain-containing protein [Oculatella sp. FACHB-28]
MTDSGFNMDLAIEQGCDLAQRFIDQLRKNKQKDMSDVRLLDAFLRQIPIPPKPDRPRGALPLKGLGLGVVQPDLDNPTNPIEPPPIRTQSNGNRSASSGSLVILTDRWDLALDKAPTTGASNTTARNQIGMAGGIAASNKMAEMDWVRVQPIIERFYLAAVKYNVPPALLAAIASRESHVGSALDRNGLGDRGNAFGIMQVDKRYHSQAGVNSDPANQIHINQGAEIFDTKRKEVIQKHRGWEDEFILKGATAAYNFGSSNVQTRIGIDRGTAGNDYGSDVIARAKWYSKRMKSLAECKEDLATQPEEDKPRTELPVNSAITIRFGQNAQAENLTSFSRKVLEDILQTANLSSALISSTSRTPAEQARVMFNNLENLGVASQKRLYGAAGDQVIDVYVQSKAARRSPTQIKADMEAKIIAIGPTRVSRHASDPRILNVFDVAPSSISNHTAFKRAVLADSRVSKFLTPPDDPAYHLEIPQP